MAERGELERQKPQRKICSVDMQGSAHLNVNPSPEDDFQLSRLITVMMLSEKLKTQPDYSPTIQFPIKKGVILCDYLTVLFRAKS